MLVEVPYPELVPQVGLVDGTHVVPASEVLEVVEGQ